MFCRKYGWVRRTIFGLVVIFFSTGFYSLASTSPSARQTSSSDASLPAITQAWQSARLFSRGTGFVERVFVDIGDQVKEGQILAKISDPLVVAEKEKLISDLEDARADLELNELELKRADELVTKNLVSKSTIDRLRIAVKKAEAKIFSLQADIRGKQAQIEFLTIRAPFTGSIIARNVDKGDMVAQHNQNTQALFEIADLSQLRVVFHIPQYETKKYRPGTPLMFLVSGNEEVQVRSELSILSPAISMETGTMRAETVINNEQNRLPSGLRGDIRLLGD